MTERCSILMTQTCAITREEREKHVQSADFSFFTEKMTSSPVRYPIRCGDQVLVTVLAVVEMIGMVASFVDDPFGRILMSEQPWNVSFSLPRPGPDFPVVYRH